MPTQTISRAPLAYAPAVLTAVYLLITSTTALVPVIAAYDAKRILQFVLLLAILLIGLLYSPLRHRFRELSGGISNIASAAILIFLAIGLMSSAFNARSLEHWLSSATEVFLFTALFSATLVIASSRQLIGRHLEIIVLSAFAMTALAVGTQELVGILAAKLNQTDFSYDVSLPYFAHPRFYNQVQSWSIPALLGLPLLFGRRLFVYLLTILALGLNCYIILMTGARGSFVSLAAATGIALLLFPMIRPLVLRIGGPSAALGIAIFGLTTLSLDSDLATSSDESVFFERSVGRPLFHTTGRVYLWQNAAEDAIRHPIIGIGPVNHACTEPEWFGHPHNFPLQVLSEWGTAAAALLAVLVLIAVLKTTKRLLLTKRTPGEDYRLSELLFTGAIAAMIHSMVSGVFIMPASQMAGVLVVGTLLGQLKANRSRGGHWPAGPVLAASALMTAIILTFGAHALRTMETRSERIDARITAPRMWQDSKACRAFISDSDADRPTRGGAARQDN